MSAGKDAMLRGLANVSFFAADLEEAARWYTELLGLEPFGNVLGVMQNPHYLAILSRDQPTGV